MTQYCTPADIATMGINPGAIEDVQLETKLAKIRAVSSLMDGYFKAQFILPLIAFEDDVRECCAVLSGAGLLETRGYGPSQDESVGIAVDRKMSWLKDISRRFVTPNVTDSSPGAVAGQPSAGPRMQSAPSQGFTQNRPTSGVFPGCGSGGSFGT